MLSTVVVSTRLIRAPGSRLPILRIMPVNCLCEPSITGIRCLENIGRSLQYHYRAQNQMSTQETMMLGSVPTTRPSPK